MYEALPKEECSPKQNVINRSSAISIEIDGQAYVCIGVIQVRMWKNTTEFGLA